MTSSSLVLTGSTPLFFGRRKGRPLGIEKQSAIASLPQFDVARWQHHWPQEVWIEIGFGFGEHLLDHLKCHPQRHIIGVEVFENGMAHACHVLAQQQDAVHRRCSLVHAPVQTLWPQIGPASVAGIHVLFPDPWPKIRHHKRRMISPPFLQLCTRLLRPGGQLHFASDHAGLVADTYDLVQACPAFVWQEGQHLRDPAAWPDVALDHWPKTRYGQKAGRQGRSFAYMVWQLKEGQIAQT